MDNVDVANNLLQAFALVKKMHRECAIVSEEDEFDYNLKPEFFVFASHGFGNCYLWQRISDEGFHVKITGYTEVIDFIYKNQQISNKTKLYPLIFMFRNTIELCLKRLFYSRVDNGVSLKVFYSKRKSHYIKKDLWKNVKPIIVRYANDSGEDLAIIDIVEKLLDEINSLDKNGDNFRYPTSYSLEYRIDDKKIDLSNVYTYLKAIINFLRRVRCLLLEAIADYESEMRASGILLILGKLNENLTSSGLRWSHSRSYQDFIGESNENKKNNGYIDEKGTFGLYIEAFPEGDVEVWLQILYECGDIYADRILIAMLFPEV